MFRNYFSCLVFSLISITSTAQYVDSSTVLDTSQYYRIYLKDGTFFKAQILEENEKETHIRLENGQKIEIKNKFVHHKKHFVKGQYLLPKGRMLLLGKQYTSISLNYLIHKTAPSEGEATASFRLTGNVVFGHRFNDYFGLGGGFGISAGNSLLIPLFVDFRGAFFKKRISPVYGFQIGYSFPLLTKANTERIIFQKRKGGFVFQPTIGLRFASLGRANTVLSLGYNFQREFVRYKIIDPKSLNFQSTIERRIKHRNLIVKYELFF